MTIQTNDIDKSRRAKANLAWLFSDRFNSRITLAPEDGNGSGDGNDSGDDDTGNDDGEGADDGDKDTGDKGAGDKGEKGDNKSKPSDAEAKLMKDLMKQKEKAKKAEADAAAAVERLKAFDGIDPDQVRALLAEKVEAEKKSLEAKGDFDRLKAMMAEEHTKALQAAQAEAEAHKTSLSQAQATIEKLTIGQSFSNSSFVNEDLILTPAKAQALYGAHFDFEDGKVVGYDKPRGASERTMLVDAAGDPLPFDASLKKLIDGDPDRDRLIKSKMKTGSDSKTVQDKTKEKTSDDLRGQSRIAAGLAALTAGKKSG